MLLSWITSVDVFTSFFPFILLSLEKRSGIGWRKFKIYSDSVIHVTHVDFLCSSSSSELPAWKPDFVYIALGVNRLQLTGEHWNKIQSYIKFSPSLCEKIEAFPSQLFVKLKALTLPQSFPTSVRSLVHSRISECIPKHVVICQKQETCIVNYFWINPRKARWKQPFSTLLTPVMDELTRVLVYVT